MWKELLRLIRERLFPASIVSIKIHKNLVASGSAHSAGDILNDSLSHSWVIPNAAGEPGGSGYITKVQAHTQVESQTFRIASQVYTREPTATMVDNAGAANPNEADEEFFEDEIALPALLSRGDASYTVATPSTVGGLPFAFTCEPGSRDLYLNVIAVSATTFTAGERLDFKFKIERVKTVRD